MEGTADQNPAAATAPTAEPESPAPGTREAAIMSEPPRDIAEVPGQRILTAAQQAALATPASRSPQINSGQFGATVVAPNEFRITHQGRDLGGKTLTPTEVPTVLGWLNSLPPDDGV